MRVYKETEEVNDQRTKSSSIAFKVLGMLNNIENRILIS